MELDILKINIDNIVYNDDPNIGIVVSYNESKYIYIGKVPAAGDLNIKNDIELKVNISYKEAFFNIKSGELIVGNNSLMDLLRKDGDINE